MRGVSRNAGRGDPRYGGGCDASGNAGRGDPRYGGGWDASGDAGGGGPRDGLGVVGWGWGPAGGIVWGVAPARPGAKHQWGEVARCL